MKTALLTGSIAAGKSTAARILMEEGACVYDSDSRAKQLYRESAPLREGISSLLGFDIIAADGSLRAADISAAVFSDRDLLAKVEQLVHPAVLNDFLQWRQNLSAGCPLCLMESAVALGNSLFDDLWDLVVWVDAPVRVRFARARARNAMTRAEFDARDRAQKYTADSAPCPVVRVHNGSTPERLREALEAALSDVL